MREFGPGWRYFECGECEHKWREACRDSGTPSGSTCPECDSWETPIKSEMKKDWPTDQGNLLRGFDYEKFEKERA